ncbi:MAG: N-acetylmuramoyl-L-alanine amidase [Thermoactinomycetaceae bacterium]|nr:N-acetylmuramoyl-L-alanine amidase [Thermoactinomycetaceae bacterium]
MLHEKDVYPSLGDRVRAANNWGADFFLSIHINAGGGDGFESFRYSKSLSKTWSIQKTLHAHIVKAMGWKDRGMKTSGELYVLKHTKMPAVLTENLFIDNPSNLKLLKQASVREKCARAHVAGMAKAFGWKKKQAGPKPPEPTGGLWVVQCGAFKEKKNAEEMKAKLEKAGFSAYVFRKS